MEHKDIVKKAINIGDRVYIQYSNELVKSGIYLGVHHLPFNKDLLGVCITYDKTQNIVDWIDLNFIKTVEITIPKKIIEEVLEK